MPIPLPASSEEPRLLDALSPREIVAELDRHVIGQGAAKRAAGKRLVRVPFESREHAIRGELLLRGNQPVDGDESALAEELGQLFTGAIKGLWAHRRARLPVFGSPSLDTVPSLYSRG